MYVYLPSFRGLHTAHTHSTQQQAANLLKIEESKEHQAPTEPYHQVRLIK
jgi:hypothetical protein